MNNVEKSKQINNIGKHDRLLITEDDYDKYIFPKYITKTLNQIQFVLIYYIVDDGNNWNLYKLRTLRS